MADPAAYFMRRDIADQDAGAQLGSQVAAPPENRLNLAGPSSGIRSSAPPENRLNLAGPSSGIRSSGFQVEPVSGVPSSHGGGVSRGELVKRRGRPRKYGPDTSFSPTSSTAPALMSSGSDVAPPKRRRGRPPGTGKKQKLASHGEWFSRSAGSDLIPHVITIAIGEDIATKIMSFSQQGLRAICILSASGAVSTATLCHYATSGGTVTYKGHFEILCLSGSYYMASDTSGSQGRSRWLNISLFGLDGRVIGGSVAGPLLATTPVQVVLGSFVHPAASNAKNKGIARHESDPESEH